MLTFSDTEIASELMLGTTRLRSGEPPYSFLVAPLHPQCDALSVSLHFLQAETIFILPFMYCN